MSKKQVVAFRPMSERIAKARKEGRTQQALELTSALVKQEPTDAHCELLRQVTLERGQQLQSQGHLRDAATVYQHALAMGGSAEFQANVIERLTACGAVAAAGQALQQVGEPAARQRIMTHIADAAVAQGLAGKQALPSDLHAAFDLVLQAFGHYEAGRDEEARAALQGIGLQSPFLEWRVLLRGLMAYTANDDARALENWSRLDPARLPSKLCAPLRANIDPGYLAAQPPHVQQTLRSRLLQHQGMTIAPLLRDLKAELHERPTVRAFRKAEQVVAALRPQHPDLVARLAECFFWAIIERGDDTDMPRYQRAFGTPSDGTRMIRLEALALEVRGMFPEAHEAWQALIDQIAANPAAWPGDSAAHAQALIWSRMAENAAFRRRRQRPSGNPFFDMFASHPAPLKPTADECLENAIKLAPDRLESYTALFELYRAQDKIPKAKKIGQQLLKRFPDHARTMEALGELCMDSRDYKKAQEYFEKALHANPLEHSLRRELARAKQNYGLALTLEKKFDKAREQYEQALPLWEGVKTPILCQWSIAELKANCPDRSRELFEQANAQRDQRLASRYAMVGESVRAALSTKAKKEFAQDLKNALAQTPTPLEILALLESAAYQRSTHEDTFHGQKTQEKTILKFLDTIHFDAFDETQLLRVSDGLRMLNARKPWLRCLDHSQRRFPGNAEFKLAYADYHLFNQGEPKLQQARQKLDAARRLAEAMPRGETQQQLLDKIQDREEIIAEMAADLTSMMSMMDQMFSGPLDDDEFEDDDEYF